MKSDHFMLYWYIACISFCIVLGLFSCHSKQQLEEPRLYRGLYEPVYVQLNNEQFERLIEALKDVQATQK